MLVSNGIDEAFCDEKVNHGIIEKYYFGDGHVCSYAGNIGLAQGLEPLLDIARERPSVRFLLFGKGTAEDRLREGIATEGVKNVMFCGVVNSEGVYTVLRYPTMTYVPLASSKLDDSISTKMREALAYGCPVLLAAAGDAAALLDYVGLGEHVSPEEPEALLRVFDLLIDKEYSTEDKESCALLLKNEFSHQKEALCFAQTLIRRYETDNNDTKMERE